MPLIGFGLAPDLSFNEAVPSKCFADFETEGQFRSAAGEIAKAARATASAIDRRFSSFEAIADFVVERARSSPDRMGPSWWGYEAGIASGLVGRTDEATAFLHSLTDERVVERAAPLLRLTADPDAFRDKINERIAHERSRLKLKPLESAVF